MSEQQGGVPSRSPTPPATVPTLVVTRITLPDTEDALLESMRALNSFLLDEASLETVLQRVVDLAKSGVPGCDHAGVTLWTRDRPTTAAATDETTLALDAAQYETGVGPCLQAIRDGVVYRVDDFETDERFREFAARAVPQGLRSSLSFPLQVRDTTIGALNLYARRTNSYTDAGASLGSAFAAQAAIALTNSQIHERTLALIGQLNEALGSRAVIEQAKGMLMARQAIDADQAFDVLRRASQNRNEKLRDLAASIVETATDRLGPTPD